jgi:hypothetical protein
MMAMVGAASGILSVLYLLIRDERPSNEPKKRRKRLRGIRTGSDFAQPGQS